MKQQINSLANEEDKRISMIGFKEYRNINGDMVKIPIKKLPLKNKPKVELNEEEQIVNKLVERNNSEIKYYAAHSVPYYNQFI